MKRYFFGSAAAVVCASALVAAQAPGSQSQQTPSQPRGGVPGDTRPSTQASAGATTTVTGCVYREQDVPGRTPNVAERAGILEDYILADVRMSPAGAGAATGTSGAAGAPGAGAGAPGAVGSAGAAGSAGAGGAAATTGSSTAASSSSASSASAGTATMYKLELVDDSKLQALVGKRVEVMGRIDAEAGDSGGRTSTGAGAGAAGGSSTGVPGATSGNPGSAGNTGSRAGAGTGVGAGAGATAGGNTGAGAGATAGDNTGAGATAGSTGSTRSGSTAIGAGAAGSAGQSQTARQADQSVGPDRIELPEFEVSSIREIAGTCAATPAGR